MRKLVGKVTTEERDEIQKLFERKNGLTELIKIISVSDKELYEHIVEDLGQTSTKSQAWWNKMQQHYQWESHDNGNWEIVFDTCEIYLNWK